MFFAKHEVERIEAAPGLEGTCPNCDRAVFPKCGELNRWHWSHHKHEACESSDWCEPESEWHFHWKMAFGKENCEISITRNGERHLADIYTKEGIVIELQNSKISKPTIRKREEFYGERMLWIINGIHFKNHFHECYSYNGFKYNYDEIAQEYYGSKSEYKGIKSEGRIMLFNWDYARRSWIDVQRDVFIDFGGYYLFWVTEGMGTKSGEGKYVGIRRIMEKYGGDYEYYLEHKSEMYSIREAL